MLFNRKLVELVRVDGQLDTTRISHKETIYTARSGMHIERFIYAGVSYIYKPCSTEAVSREQWAQQHLIPSIPNVRVPHIMASDSESSWIIYEDLGPLVHCDHVEEIIRAAGVIQMWHRLPTYMVPDGVVGHSPLFTQVRNKLSVSTAYFENVLGACGISRSALSSWWTQLPTWERLIEEQQVISHGDYYRLNIAFRSEQVIVLDWEFVHLNSVYWDLYSLMDITSHRYVRTPLEHASRVAALKCYWLEGERSIHGEQFNYFVHGYYAFASVYSAWILTLIEGDLRQASAPVTALRRQRQETVEVLQQCLQGLGLNDIM